MRKNTHAIILLLMAGLNISRIYAQNVKDFDGNIYRSVNIGTQTWMAENLKTTKFSDGTPIHLAVLSENEWAEHTVSALTTPAYCWLFDSASVYRDNFGAFYNGFAVSSGKLCPSGWHVPSDGEWTILTTFLGGENIAGSKLKETGVEHWHDGNEGATNETGFTARAGGGIEDNGANWSFGHNGSWWSSTHNDDKTLWTRLLYGTVPNLYRNYADRHVGFPVRCIKTVTE